MPDVGATLVAAGGDDAGVDDEQASAASVSAIALVRATTLEQVFDMVSYWARVVESINAEGGQGRKGGQVGRDECRARRT